MKKINLLLVSSIILVLASSLAFAQNEEASEKAKQVHDMAASDVIYSQEEIKALYYQNLEVIDLLKQIRDLLAQKLNESKSK